MNFVKELINYYIENLQEAGIFYQSDADPFSFSLSELKNMFWMFDSLK